MTGSSCKPVWVEIDSTEITEGVYSKSSEISAMAFSSISSPYNSWNIASENDVYVDFVTAILILERGCPFSDVGLLNNEFLITDINCWN